VAGGVVLGLVPLVLALGALGVFDAAGVTDPVAQLLAVTAAGAAGGLARFTALRTWVFVARPTPAVVRAAGAGLRTVAGRRPEPVL